MPISLILQMIGMALLAVLIYTFVGFIPGTDETSVLLPVSLALVLAGVAPVLVLTFFIASIVSLNLTNLMPTALVGLPGGVLSAPLIEHAMSIKSRGKSAEVIRKMAAAAVIGVVISVPISFLIAGLIAPFAEQIQPYASLIFVIGAIFLSLMSKNKLLSLLSIIPMAMLFMGLRHLYWGTGVVSEGTTITTSFFLGITIGPLIISLLGLLNRDSQKSLLLDKYKEIRIPTGDTKTTLNPFKILNKEEGKWAILMGLLSNFLFILSPVGLILLMGEVVQKRIKKDEDKASGSLVTMSALAQTTYLSGIIIPLFALGIPLSPVAIGPGNALFNAPPVYGLENNLHYQLSRTEFVVATLIGAIIAVTLVYILIHRYAFKITNFIMRRVSHEAVLGLFVAFILLLAYMDAGLINVFGVMLIGITCGALNKLGVNYGVQFMTLYAAPLIIQTLSGL